jgi:hypothetical protein
MRPWYIEVKFQLQLEATLNNYRVANRFAINKKQTRQTMWFCWHVRGPRVRCAIQSCACADFIWIRRLWTKEVSLTATLHGNRCFHIPRLHYSLKSYRLTCALIGDKVCNFNSILFRPSKPWSHLFSAFSLKGNHNFYLTRVFRWPMN